MHGYMNAEALRRTLELGEAVYWSRSRQALWHKGATSGLVQKVVEVRVDDDQDAIWLRVEVRGGASCHVGYRSCFYRRVPVGEQGGSRRAGGSRLHRDREGVRPRAGLRGRAQPDPAVARRDSAIGEQARCSPLALEGDAAGRASPDRSTTARCRRRTERPRVGRGISPAAGSTTRRRASRRSPRRRWPSPPAPPAAPCSRAAPRPASPSCGGAVNANSSM